MPAGCESSLVRSSCIPFRRGLHVKHRFQAWQHDARASFHHDRPLWRGGPSGEWGYLHSAVRLQSVLPCWYRVFDGGKLQCAQLRIVIDQDRLPVAHLAFEDEPRQLRFHFLLDGAL